MKKASLEEAEVIPRDYGVMKMLAGSGSTRTQKGDLRILEIEPGKSTSKHHHKLSESVFHVVKGKLAMEVEQERVEISEGDTLVIEPLEVHRLTNTGDGLAIVMETMAPPFSKRDIYYSEE